MPEQGTKGGSDRNMPSTITYSSHEGNQKWHLVSDQNYGSDTVQSLVFLLACL